MWNNSYRQKPYGKQCQGETGELLTQHVDINDINTLSNLKVHSFSWAEILMHYL